MNTKRYLSEISTIERNIGVKKEKIISLKCIAENCSPHLSGMPHNPHKSSSHMADAVCKIIDLENEINADIDQLVDLKRDMVAAIKAVADPECQTLLELRYLCFKSWEQIAVAMGYGVRHVYKLHNSALETFEVPKS